MLLLREMILIRSETKIVKDIIMSKYPNIKFTIQYKAVRNYIDSSDKIVVKLYDKHNMEDIVTLLREHVQNIAVYREGEVASVYGKFNAKIANVDFSEYIEPDLLEFIEVRCK